MNLLKSAQVNAGPGETIGASTSRYTKPLVLKVIATFVLMFVLLVSISIFALYNLNRGKDASHQALNLQINANLFQNMREAVVSERVSVLNDLYTGQADPDLKNYQDAFDQDQRGLLNHGLETYSLLTAHNQLRDAYGKVLDAANSGQATQARAFWQDADTQAEGLLKLLDMRRSQADQLAQEAANKADQIQNEASSLTLWVALLAFVITAGLIYFVLVNVVRPLRVLNHNLTQLLWSQTEHLTGQLNVLQAEINVHNDMLTTVRHDLKSPLSSIKGLAELCTILQPDLSGDVKENLGKIVEMADSSVGTISDVLARREQKLELETINLESLVDKVLQLVDLRYYNVQRKVEADEWVMDTGLMEHALLNLISNARKFSSQGIGVGVRKVRKPGTVDTVELELWVWNDGAVITGEDRAEIFKPGKQTSEGKKAGGHGLGLYIVKAIAERHHGRVMVESHEKVGTTFRIFIPQLSLDNPNSAVITSQPAEEADSSSETLSALLNVS